MHTSNEKKYSKFVVSDIFSKISLWCSRKRNSHEKCNFGTASLQRCVQLKHGNITKYFTPIQTLLSCCRKSTPYSSYSFIESDPRHASNLPNSEKGRGFCSTMSQFFVFFYAVSSNFQMSAWETGATNIGGGAEWAGVIYLRHARLSGF